MHSGPQGLAVATCAVLFTALLVTCRVVDGQQPPEIACDCMEYWKCVMGGGTPSSYCGLSASSVCCFSAVGAQPLTGFFPSAASISGDGQCGRKGPQAGPSGIAMPGEWPWHVAILEMPDELYVCGASLVDENWVLTAAHCVDDYVGANGSALLKVRLGEFDVSSSSEPLAHEERGVAQVMLHPGFDNRTLAHDIALLRMRVSAARRPHVDVVCLPRRDQDEKGFNTCFITGWGRRTEDTEHSIVLKEVQVPLWDQADCEQALRQRFGADYSLPATAICAGAEGRDACDGDGGGPLVCEATGQWYQVGVISFGIGCGRVQTPGVYTRVSRYEQWITDVILGQQSAPAG